MYEVEGEEVEPMPSLAPVDRSSGETLYVTPLPHRTSFASPLFASVQTLLTTLVTFYYWGR
jgi:hypothetical protein